MSVARFTRRWHEGAPLRVMAAEFGCSTRTITEWVRKLGLPGRTGGAPRNRHVDEILAMYRFGVEVKPIAAALGLHWATVLRTVQMSGTPMRGKGFMSKQARVTVDDYRAAQLAEAMKREAAVTRAAMRDSEMVDRIGARWAA
jgi:hypothetical protein